MISVDAIRSRRELENFEAILSKQTTKGYLVWRVMLTGVMRVSDVLNLKQIDAKRALKSGVLTYKEKKTKKQRQVKLSKGLKSALESAYAESNANGWLYLFESVSRNKSGSKQLARQSVSRWLSNAADNFNLLYDTNYVINCHTARKTAGYLLRLGGVDTAIISQKVFGHANEEITRRYLGITDECGAAAMDTLSDMLEPSGDSHLQLSII